MPEEICRLCLEPRELLDSHILPELAYRQTYNEITRAAVVVNFDKGTRRLRQRGFTERLLCRECEQHISKWETYFARVWHHPESSLRPSVLPNQLERISGLDYAKFKLFHMSILWRASVATIEPFETVRLGEHEERLRLQLLKADPGEVFDYPFFGVAMRDPTSHGFQDGFMKQFSFSDVDGTEVYTALFCGVLWHYFVDRPSDDLLPVAFSESGELVLLVENWTDNGWVRDLAVGLSRLRES